MFDYFKYKLRCFDFASFCIYFSILIAFQGALKGNFRSTLRYYNPRLIFDISTYKITFCAQRQRIPLDSFVEIETAQRLTHPKRFDSIETTPAECYQIVPNTKQKIHKLRRTITMTIMGIAQFNPATSGA